MKPSPDDLPLLAFAEATAWDAWLASADESKGVWLQFAKAGNGVASVTYDEAIDGRAVRRDDGAGRDSPRANIAPLGQMFASRSRRWRRRRQTPMSANVSTRRCPWVASPVRGCG